MKLTTLTLALSIALGSSYAVAAEKKEEKKPQTLSEMIKGQTEFAGIFNLYQDVAWGADTATKAHKKYIDRLISKALEA
jgi:cytochrome c556